jgi:hypothetical protein
VSNARSKGSDGSNGSNRSSVAPGAAGAALAESGPPHGVDLFAYAAISADLAEGDRPASQVVEARGLTMDQWTEASLLWTRRMGEDPRVLTAFSDAFARAQDQKKPLAPLTLEDWAALNQEIAEDGAPARALAARGLSVADHCRLVRHWAKALGGDPALARRYEAAGEAWEEARRSGGG